MAKVDEKDFNVLSEFKWYFRSGYAVRTKIFDGVKKTIWMHRLIMGNPRGKEIDHINRDRLDNRRVNLRICSRTENSRNSAFNNTISGFKGVHKSKKRWQAHIRIGGKLIHLGLFLKIEDAAKKYDETAKKYFGEFACTNLELGRYQ